MTKQILNFKAFMLFCIIIVSAIFISGCTEKPEEIENTNTGPTPDEGTRLEEASDKSEHTEEAVEHHWGYDGEEGPDHWTELGYIDCSGNEQSPVDVPAGTSPGEADISFNYVPSGLNIVNNGHTIKLAYDEGSTIEVENKTYKLLQFHFHSPSEHTFNSKYYDMEMHLVHQSDDGEYAVLGVMLAPGNENNAYTPVLTNMPEEEGEVKTISGINVNAVDLLPENMTYYRYDGSFTTPPCTEEVKWFVSGEPEKLSKEQIDNFKAIYSNNNRPVQPLNLRKFS